MTSASVSTFNLAHEQKPVPLVSESETQQYPRM